MTYPEHMLPFKEEISKLSSYLTSLKQDNSLSNIDNKQVAEIFKFICAQIDPEVPDEFGQMVADAFIFNLSKLYKEIGNAITVENKAIIATMVEATFKKVIEEVNGMGNTSNN